MRVFASVFVALLCTSAGCGEDTVTTLPESDAATDVAAEVSEPLDATTDAATDGSGLDSASADSTTIDSAPADTGTPDTGSLDVGSTFTCASDTCGTTLQFCRRATTPGICPALDSGICPAGCPDCPTLPMTCETMPMKCWAKPSCNCILVEVCGSVAAGNCVEKDGGFVAGCHGV